MKLLIAIDSFKGCITSKEASLACKNGIKQVYEDAEIINVPIADGGEGTVDSLIGELGGTIVELEVNDPLMRRIRAKYGILKDHTAVIEMASAAGLPLLKPAERNPIKTTTMGVGELICDAIGRGCREFIIGIGGSSTNDAGIGMLQALGYEFYDEARQLVKPIGESLQMIKYIDSSKRLKELDECKFLIACDVNNPLFGQRGAAYVYAKQKGADEQMIQSLDLGLQNFAFVTKTFCHHDFSNLQGSGAAGGLGFGFCSFLNGQLMPGIDIIFQKIDIEEKIKGVDLIITGEGKMDIQSSMGKVLTGVALLGKKYNIPVIGIAGTVTDEAYQMHELGMTALFSIINEPMSLEDAMNKVTALRLIEKKTIEIFRLIKSFRS